MKKNNSKMNDFVMDKLSAKFSECAYNLMDASIECIGYANRNLSKEQLVNKAKDAVIKLFIDSKFDNELLPIEYHGCTGTDK